MSNVTEISYGNYTENDCYFFTYDHVNIDFLSILFNRTRESIIYQNGRITDYARIFCNENICSIHQSYDSYVNGIIVKISMDELEILKSYYKNYTLRNTIVHCTSSRIAYEKVISYGRSMYRATNHPSIRPYVFVYNDYINDEQIVPTESYINEIRKMLNDRTKIKICQVKPIKFHCVKHNNIPKKYKDDLNDLYDLKYKIIDNHIDYNDSDNDTICEHIVIIGYEIVN
jgi:hypothetical protein